MALKTVGPGSSASIYATRRRYHESHSCPVTQAYDFDIVQSLAMEVGYGDLPSKKEEVGLILDCIHKLDRRRCVPFRAKEI
jgi:hypothetical protein